MHLLDIVFLIDGLAAGLRLSCKFLVSLFSMASYVGEASKYTLGVAASYSLLYCFFFAVCFYTMLNVQHEEQSDGLSILPVAAQGRCCH